MNNSKLGRMKEFKRKRVMTDTFASMI